MLRFGAPGSRLESTLQTIDGAEFKAFVSLSTKRLSSNISIEYNLRLPRNSIVRPGTVVIFGEHKFIVAEGSEGFFAGPNFILRRMIQVTDELPWSRRTSTIDPVSKLERTNSTPTPLGTAYGMLMVGSQINDIFQVQDSRYHFITGQPVMINDLIGPYSVTFVAPRIGIWFAEVK